MNLSTSLLISSLTRAVSSATRGRTDARSTPHASVQIAPATPASTMIGPSAANNAGPALASMLIYLLMAAVLFFRPQGLFPAVRG